MRRYKEYMDKRTAGPELHARIMSRLGRAPKRTRDYRTAGRIVAVAACGALVFGTILTMPRWLSNLQTEPAGSDSWESVAPSLSGAATDTGKSGTSLDTRTTGKTSKKPTETTKTGGTQGSRPTASQEKRLIFNKSTAVGKTAYLPGFFREILSDAKLSELLGGALPLLERFGGVGGSAGFTGEGALYTVSASASREDGEWAARVTMAKGKDGVPTDYVYGGEKTVSRIGGTAVTAGMVSFSDKEGDGRCHASFTFGGTSYQVEVNSNSAEAQSRLADIVEALVTGKAADLSTVTYTSIPPWKEEDLTQAQAQAYPTLGAYVPESVPKGFAFEAAHRSLGQNKDSLSLTYCKGLNDIHWTIRPKTANDDKNLVDVSQPKTYDLSLYPVPRADSVPDELYYQVNYPLFRAEQLTLDAVKKRVWSLNGSEKRMEFSVLYGDMLVDLSTEAVEPETLFAMLEKLK